MQDAVTSVNVMPLFRETVSNTSLRCAAALPMRSTLVLPDCARPRILCSSAITHAVFVPPMSRPREYLIVNLSPTKGTAPALNIRIDFTWILLRSEMAGRPSRGPIFTTSASGHPLRAQNPSLDTRQPTSANANNSRQMGHLVLIHGFRLPRYIKAPHLVKESCSGYAKTGCRAVVTPENPLRLAQHLHNALALAVFE
jgi:hypothetical protein